MTFRNAHAMAYDNSGRGTVMLFGGNRVLFGTENDKDTFLDDMWEWDGARWHEIKTTTPPARAEAYMVYDSARRRLVLFGGYNVVAGQRTCFGDTWEWDGKTWKQVSTNGPSPQAVLRAYLAQKTDSTQHASSEEAHEVVRY